MTETDWKIGKLTDAFPIKSLIEYSEEDYFCDLNAQFLALPKNAQDVRVNEIIRTGLDFVLKTFAFV